MTTQDAFTTLVASHIESIVARKLERFYATSECLTLDSACYDEEVERLTEETRQELAPLFYLFAQYVKNPRMIFALTLQRIEESELNSLDTGASHFTDEYDGNATEAELNDIFTAHGIAPTRKQAKRFDTLVHDKKVGCKVMRNATQYVEDRYYRNHFPHVLARKSYNVVELKQSSPYVKRHR